MARSCDGFSWFFLSYRAINAPGGVVSSVAGMTIGQGNKALPCDLHSTTRVRKNGLCSQAQSGAQSGVLTLVQTMAQTVAQTAALTAARIARGARPHPHGDRDAAPAWRATS